MHTAVQYIDTAMVGSLGTDATAAVGSTGNFGWMIISSFSALGVGFLAQIAKACGAGEEDYAKRIVAQAMMLVLAVGSFTTVVCSVISPYVPVWMQVDPSIQKMAATYFFIIYLPMLPRTASMIFGTILRAVGDTKTPMKVGIIVNCINIVLNFLLIYPSRTIRLLGGTFMIPGANLGVIGAAVASAIAFTWGGIHVSAVLWRHPQVSPKGLSLKPDLEIMKPCIRIAFPNMLQRFGNSLGFVFFSAMVNTLGPVATATHTIANTVESAFYIPGYGMETAASTLAGHAYGARDNRRMKEQAAMFIPMVLVLMILSGGLLFALAPGLMNIFSDNPEVIRLGSKVLRMVACSEPFYGFYIIVEGLMLGVGKTKTSFAYNITGMWLIRVAGTFVCTQILGLGLVSVWSCMIAHNLFLFGLYLIAYVRKTWNPLEY